MESPDTSMSRGPTRQSKRIALANAKVRDTETSSTAVNEDDDSNDVVLDNLMEYEVPPAGLFVNVDLKVEMDPQEFYEEDGVGDKNEPPQPSRAKAIVAKLAQKLNSKLNAEFTPRSTDSLLACLEPEVSVATEGTITSGSVYVCPWCPLTSSLPETIEEHKKVCHPVPSGKPEISSQSQHICEVCGKEFARSWHLKRHFIIHSGERPFICVDCGDTFVTAGDLSFHHQRDHTTFACKLCPETFARIAYLKLHSKIHRSESGKWRCFVCDSEYDTKSDLIDHQTTHAMLNSIMKGVCEQCGMSFKSVVDLENHMKSHIVIHACPLCNKSFKQSTTLTEHMRNMHKVEPPGKTGKMSALFVCLQCQREYDNILSLKQHLQMHSWAKPCKCPECGDCFRGANDLKVHMRVHTGERPFQCPVCHERFTQKGNLNVHIRTHTGEKPFECQICGRCFLKSSNLKEHLKVHQDKVRVTNNNEGKMKHGMMALETKKMAQDSKSFRAAIAGKLMKTGFASLPKNSSESFKQKIANKLMKTGFKPQTTTTRNFGDTIAERLLKAGTLSFDNGNISLRLL
ncbi:Zinc finger protein 287 [Frankliniella fusca]|uniref:Zinc finger protein 287 n=1 Tax=Frankliniella fusca TaxID=407009 RepID=A0AAE1I156_9NEOP|nr:Zinc finger protein 287 [Frankliniella fusca]